MQLPQRAVIIASFACLVKLSEAHHPAAVVVDHYHGEEQAVNAVQHAAVAGDEAACVLNSHLALNHGYGQIAQGKEGADESAQYQTVNKAQSYVQTDQKSDRYSANPAPYRSFPGLPGAQPGEELVTPQG